jgi:hypothetical protein
MASSLACTEKGKPHNNHEGAKPGPQTQPLQTPDTAIPSGKISTDLNTLADKVLDHARVQNPKSLLDRSTRDDLLALNKMILELKAEQTAQPEFRALARKYSNAVILDCGDFRDSCTGLRYFKTAANSSQVVKTFAKLLPDNRIRLILIALELKNRLWDGELVEILIAAAASPHSTEEIKDLEKIQSMLAAAFTSAAAKIQDRAEARKFLESMNGWAVLTNPQLKFADAARVSVFELAARADFLREQNGELNLGAKAIMDKAEENPNSAIAKQKVLQAQKIFIPEAAGARPINKYDELTFLLDGIYLGNIQPQAGNILFRSLGRTSRQLREALENYLRLHFLSATLEGTQQIARILAAPVESDASLRHVIAESADITRVWQTFLSQSGPLRSFAMLALADAKDTSQREVRNMFDSLPRTITRSAVYPHMLVLFHQLSQKRFELYMRFSGKAIDTALIMRWLFEGKIPPLFPYTDDELPLTYFELPHAFDLAVRTGVFGIMNLDVDVFMADTLRRLSEDHIKAIDKSMDLTRTRLTETTNMRDFRAFCAEVKGGPKRSREFYFGDINDSPYFGRTRYLMSVGMSALNSDSQHTSTDRGELQRTSLGLNFADGTFNEALELNRLELGSALRAGEAMLAAYQDYLTRFVHLSADDVAKRTVQTRATLDMIRNKRKDTLSFANDLFQELGTCYLKAALLDRGIMERAIEYERIYLRHVHALLTRMRSQDLNLEQRASLTKQIQFSGLPNGFTGRDRLSESGYRANQVDLLIRITRYLTEGLNLNGQQLPPIAPHLKIHFGEQLTLDTRIVRETVDGLLTYVEKPEDFVGSAFKLYFRNKNGFLLWRNLNSHPLTTSTDMLKNAISMYRTEFEIYGRAGRVSPEQTLRMHEDLIDLVRITPQEREIMELTQIFRKIDKLYLDRRFIRTNERWETIQDVLGLFDFPLSLLTVEQLGFVWDQANQTERIGTPPVRQTMFLGGQNYYNSRNPISRGNPVIGFNSAVDQQMDRSFIGFVKSELKAIHTFQESAQSYFTAIEKRPAAQQPYFDVDLRTSVRAPLYNPGAFQDFNALENNFHRQTSGLYR